MYHSFLAKLAHNNEKNLRLQTLQFLQELKINSLKSVKF